MKNKSILLFILFLSLYFPFFSQEKEEKKLENVYFFLKDYIGQEITLVVSNIDIPLTGKLMAVYNEGLLIETIFSKQKIFVFNNFIILVKIKRRE